MSRPVLPSQSFQRGLVEDIRFASEALAVPKAANVQTTRQTPADVNCLRG
jgi:hypothetical protein